MNQWPGGMTIGRGKSQPPPPAHSRMNVSFVRLPLRITCPPTIAIRSPGPPTTRLMKFCEDFSSPGVLQACGWPSPWVGLAHC
jgi:hypothetical protein